MSTRLSEPTRGVGAMHSHAPLPGRHLIEPAGLAALRLAIAFAQEPHGSGRDRLAFRSTDPEPAGAIAGTPVAARGLPPQRTRAPSFDDTAPTADPEPVGEQIAVMALVERTQAGDGEAFGQLYDRYITVVYRYVVYRVPDHSLAEDLTSETFLRALRRISSYSWQGRDFGAWLVTIARNLIADHYKSSRYRLELATSDLVEAGADRGLDGPEKEVMAGITNATLFEAVKKLGSEQQECIVLRFLQGMSVAETATILGKNESSIKALQYRAVKTLGRLLPKELLA